LHPDPVLLGGRHENERRAGTENLAGIAGLAEAMERFIKSPVFERSKLAPLVTKLIGTIEKIDGAVLVGSRK
jgi:cysteine desulfurase